MELSVEATGPRDAPAIVFLHGVAAAGWMWWRQVPAFGDFRCLCVDLPAHGRSRELPWVSLADAAGQVATLIRAHASTGRAHLVGLSLGGHVALELLGGFPDVVERAVVSGVTVEPLPHRRLYAAQVRMTTWLLRSRRLVDAQSRALGLPPAAFAEGIRALPPATYRRIAAEVAGWALPASFGAVRSPTLVVAGGRESDLIQRSVRVLPAIAPAADGRIVPGVGHGWNVEAPEEFNAVLKAWITGAPLPAELVVPRAP